jgi:hypothetical protein
VAEPGANPTIQHDHWRARCGRLFFVLLFPGFTLLIGQPMSLYLGNQGSFTLEAFELLTLGLLGLGISLAVLTPTLALVQGKYHARLVALTFAIALCLWVQGNVLAWNYGPFDGRSFDWASYSAYGMIDTTLWIVVIAAGLILARVLFPLARFASILLVSIGIVQLGIAYFQSPPPETLPSIKRFAIENENKFSYSQDQNILVLVLDAFQGDIVDEIFQHHDDLRDAFAGFTLYRNAVAGSNFTQLAIPAILTGQIFDNAQPRSEFMRHAYLNYGLPAILKRAGVETELYPWIGWANESIYFDESVASNVVALTEQPSRQQLFSEQKAKELLNLLDLAFFQTLPHYVKPHIHNDYQGFLLYYATWMTPQALKTAVSSDHEFGVDTFLRSAQREFRVDRSGTVFKYYHLYGAHQPLNVNENLEFTGQSFPFTRENYVNQVTAVLKATAEFLDLMKSSDIYDESMIVIIGDHGKGTTPDVHIRTPGHGEIPSAVAGYNRNFRRDKARAVPVVLVKPPGAAFELLVSDSPVSVIDVPATVLAELGIEDSHTGVPVGTWNYDSPRPRRYAAFDFTATKGDYVGPIVMYQVVGHSWDDDSWSVESVLAPPTADAIKP